jgi:ankyrin repeat protein
LLGETVKLLLQAGADVSRQCQWWFDRRSETYLLTGWTAACLAAKEGHTDVLKLLPRQASDTSCLPGAFLLDAVRRGDARPVEKTVREFSSNEKRAALEMAVQKANVAAARALIRDGALDRTDSELLRSVLRSKSRDLALVLIEAGIDCKTADDGGEIAIGIAAENGDAVVIRKLLAAGADPNQTSGHDPGETPLMIAAGMGHIESLKVLIAGGAKINAADVHGRTALMVAVRNQQMAAARLLVGAGQS